MRRHRISRAAHEFKLGVALVFIGPVIMLAPIALIYELILWIGHLL